MKFFAIMQMLIVLRVGQICTKHCEQNQHFSFLQVSPLFRSDNYCSEANGRKEEEKGKSKETRVALLLSVMRRGTKKKNSWNLE